jgi:hypothetical protein
LYEQFEADFRIADEAFDARKQVRDMPSASGKKAMIRR